MSRVGNEIIMRDPVSGCGMWKSRRRSCLSVQILALGAAAERTQREQIYRRRHQYRRNFSVDPLNLQDCVETLNTAPIWT